MSLHWWSIEVRDGTFSARSWRDGYGAALVEAALTHGARDWHWHHEEFGVVLEIGFADEDAWLRYRQLPAVTAALDAVPADALYVYRGRGGSAGAGRRRRGGPTLGAGAAPLPQEHEYVLVARPQPIGA